MATIVPLVRPATGLISAAARQAFGSVAIARPDSADKLALLLIHEFQHVKLGALMDFFDLYDPADSRRYHVGWRPDARPIDAALQGTYAHAAVADVWRARWHRAAEDGPANGLAQSAAAHFVSMREQVAAAVEVLLGSGSLEPLGARLVESIAERVALWMKEPAPREALAQARFVKGSPLGGP